MNQNEEMITISVGDLGSIATISLKTQEGLTQFNDCWKRGKKPTVVWDMRDLRQGKINVAATSFFLAIAHRVRSYSESAQPILIDWRPKSFSFLSDIGFFSISDRYDLFEWPYQIGGFEGNTTNPNTLLSSYDSIAPIDAKMSEENISEWKKIHREIYRREIIELCESLFTSSDRVNFRFGGELPLTISRTCAELVTNSILWGGATAFVGLQRNSKGIIICVSDIGVGIKNSLMSKTGDKYKLTQNHDDDLKAILIASSINEKDFGLKRAISSVVNYDGNISISSNSSELHWANSNWQKFIQSMNDADLITAIESFPPSIRGKTTVDDKKSGYHRKWDMSIRGTRISFFIPLDNEGSV